MSNKQQTTISRRAVRRELGSRTGRRQMGNKKGEQSCAAKLRILIREYEAADIRVI